MTLPSGLAADAAGDLFVADNISGTITEIASGGTQRIVAAGLSAPSQIAIDGAGNLYVGTTGAASILTEIPAGCSASSCWIQFGGNFSNPIGVAVDGAGDVFVADSGSQQIVEIPVGCSAASCQVSLLTGITGLQALAIDSAANLYFTQGSNVVEVPAGCASASCQRPIGSGFVLPGMLSVDAAGDVFIADPGASRAYEVTAAGLQIALGAPTERPTGIAADASGNIYFGDYSGYVFESSRSLSPTLNFAATNVGAVSADSPQSLQIQNIGNAPLIASALAISPGFYQAAGGGTPPDCASTTTIAPGGMCNLSLGFNPAAVGPATGSATLTDNALNSTAGTQTIQLSGTGLIQNQTITFNTIPPQYGGSVLNLASYATASSGLAVSFSTTTPAICSLSGTSLTIVGASTCTVKAMQPGNALFNAAASVSQSFVTHHSNQTISVTVTSPQYVTTSVTLSASASSGLPVTLASNTPAICTVSGNTASLLASGTCTIQAAQAGNGAYFSYSMTKSFTVQRDPQTLTFSPIASQNALATVSLTATATSGLPVSFNSLTATICTVSGTTANLIAAGTCTLQATQTGNATFAAAPPNTQNFTVHHLNQTLSFQPVLKQTVGASLALVATATSGLPVAFTSLTPAQCTVAGSTATFLLSGVCQIQASVGGNAVYFGGFTATRSFQISAASQTIAFSADSSAAGGKHSPVGRHCKLRATRRLHLAHASRLHRDWKRSQPPDHRFLHDPSKPGRQWRLRRSRSGIPDLHHQWSCPDDQLQRHISANGGEAL